MSVIGLFEFLPSDNHLECSFCVLGSSGSQALPSHCLCTSCPPVVLIHSFHPLLQPDLQILIKVNSMLLDPWGKVLHWPPWFPLPAPLGATTAVHSEGSEGGLTRRARLKGVLIICSHFQLVRKCYCSNGPFMFSSFIVRYQAFFVFPGILTCCLK